MQGFTDKLRHKAFGKARVRLLGGFTLHVHRGNDDLISNTLVCEGVWEPLETRLFLELLQPGATFVDVGANLGYYSVLAAKAVGEEGRVISFEPAPRNLELLRRNVESNRCKSVEIVAAAASDEAGGELQLHLAAENQGDHRVSQEGEAEARRQTVAVPRTTVDEAVGSRHVDLIKIDTQGAEAHVFRGMRNLVAANPELRVITEFWPYGLERAGSDPRALLDEFTAAGLALELILDEMSPRQPQAGELTAPIRPDEVLALLAGHRFEQHVNLLLRRSAP